MNKLKHWIDIFNQFSRQNEVLYADPKQNDNHHSPRQISRIVVFDQKKAVLESVIKDPITNYFATYATFFDDTVNVRQKTQSAAYFGLEYELDECEKQQILELFLKCQFHQGLQNNFAWICFVDMENSNSFESRCIATINDTVRLRIDKYLLASCCQM